MTHLPVSVSSSSLWEGQLDIHMLSYGADQTITTNGHSSGASLQHQQVSQSRVRVQPQHQQPPNKSKSVQHLKVCESLIRATFPSLLTKCDINMKTPLLQNPSHAIKNTSR